MSEAAHPGGGLAATVSLSLISHTNVGKTTLARTLLGRDIGEVRDEAHVTDRAEAHVLVESPAGDRLLLWDTPGFGDSQRLARRLEQAGKPIGWFMSEVWDRFRDRGFWSSQRALRNVLDQADVVLYLVNASEAPEDAAYLDAELKVLALIGKPVVALLNQLGPAGADQAQGALDGGTLDQRWQQRLQAHAGVRAVLPLDAFNRCWVQEGRLWAAVAELLAADQRDGFERLQNAWQQRQQANWRAAMDELARRLTRAALDHEPVAGEGWLGPVRSLGRSIGQGLGKVLGSAAAAIDGAPGSPQHQAMTTLAERLDQDVRLSTDALIRLHGLDGHAGQALLARLARHYATRAPIDEGRAALWGGMVSGALAGLKADLATGGLTLGGGLLAGGVLGALTAAGTAHGVNRIRGLDQPLVAWDERVLNALLSAALLGYLAVAHHGRGRGAWVQQDPPSAWTEAVAGVVAEHQDAIDELWPLRQRALTGRAFGAADQTPLQNLLQGLLCELSAELLARLYPDAPPIQHAARG